MSWHTIPDFAKQDLPCGCLCPWPPLLVDVLKSRKPPKAFPEMNFSHTHPMIFLTYLSSTITSTSKHLCLFWPLPHPFVAQILDVSITSVQESWLSQALSTSLLKILLFSPLLHKHRSMLSAHLLHCELLKTMYWFFLFPIDCVIMFMLFQTMFS